MSYQVKKVEGGGVKQSKAAYASLVKINLAP